MRNIYRMLVGKPVGVYLFGRARSVWRITVRWNIRRLVVGNVSCVARIQDSANIRAVGLTDSSATAFVQYLVTVGRRRPFRGCVCGGGGVRTPYKFSQLWLVRWCGCICATTPPNQKQRYILTDYFNNYNFSKAKIIRSLMMVIEPKHVGAVLV
jgi:hypothetical protein